MASALAVMAIVACSACGADQPAAASRSLVTPTTQIAGAGVL
ncbi:MAG: iron-siderophore ABC transporter substrate-binding protein, partial [Mycobacterium sp.]